MIEVKEVERTPRGMEESLCSVIEHNSDIIEKMEYHQIITVITILLMFHFKIEVGKSEHEYLHQSVGKLYRMIEFSHKMRRKECDES